MSNKDQKIPYYDFRTVAENYYSHDHPIWDALEKVKISRKALEHPALLGTYKLTFDKVDGEVQIISWYRDPLKAEYQSGSSIYSQQTRGDNKAVISEAPGSKGTWYSKANRSATHMVLVSSPLDVLKRLGEMKNVARPDNELYIMVSKDINGTIETADLLLAKYDIKTLEALPGQDKAFEMVAKKIQKLITAEQNGEVISHTIAKTERQQAESDVTPKVNVVDAVPIFRRPDENNGEILLSPESSLTPQMKKPEWLQTELGSIQEAYDLGVISTMEMNSLRIKAKVKHNSAVTGKVTPLSVLSEQEQKHFIATTTIGDITPDGLRLNQNVKEESASLDWLNKHLEDTRIRHGMGVLLEPEKLALNINAKSQHFIASSGEKLVPLNLFTKEEADFIKLKYNQKNVSNVKATEEATIPMEQKNKNDRSFKPKNGVSKEVDEKAFQLACLAVKGLKHKAQQTQMITREEWLSIVMPIKKEIINASTAEVTLDQHYTGVINTDEFDKSAKARKVDTPIITARDIYVHRAYDKTIGTPYVEISFSDTLMEDYGQYADVGLASSRKRYPDAEAVIDWNAQVERQDAKIGVRAKENKERILTEQESRYNRDHVERKGQGFATM